MGSYFLCLPASPCGTADVNLHATDGKPLRPPLDPQFLLTGILTFGAFTSIKQVDENHVSILQPQKKKLVTLWELIYWSLHHHGDLQRLGSSCKKHQQAIKEFDLWSLPMILVYYRTNLGGINWTQSRDFQLEPWINWNLCPGTSPCVYDLVAVSSLYGTTMVSC